MTMLERPQAPAEQLPPATPPRKRADPKLLEGMLSNDSTWKGVLPPEVLGPMEETIGFAGDAAAARRKIAVKTFVADRFNLSGKEVSEKLPLLMKGFAKDVWKHEGPIDVDTFYQKAGEMVQKERGEREMLQSAAALMIEPAGTGMEWDEWQYANMVNIRMMPGYDNEKSDFYRESMRAMYAAVQDSADRYATELKTVEGFFEASRSMEATLQSPMGPVPQNVIDRNVASVENNRANREAMDAAVAAIQSIPPEDRMMVMQMALARQDNPQANDTGYVDKIFTAFGFGAKDLGEGLVGSMIRNLSLSSYRKEETPMAERWDIRRDLAQGFRRRTDVVTSDNYWAQGALDFSRSLGVMSVAAIPGGIFAVGIMAKEDLRREFKAQGIGNRESEVMATIGAVPYAGLEFLQARMLFLGKVPGLNAILKPIKNAAQLTLGGFAKRGTAALGVNAIENMAQEIAQDVVSPTVQMTAKIFDDTIPGVDFAGSFTETLKASPVTFAALAPAILFGGGHATFRDRAQGRMYLNQRVNLLAVGFSEAQADQVQNAKTAQEREDTYKKLWKEREAIGSDMQQAALARIDGKVDAMAAMMEAEDAKTPPPIGDDPAEGGTAEGDAAAIEATAEKIRELRASTSVQEMNEKGQTTVLADDMGAAITTVAEAELLQENIQEIQAEMDALDAIENPTEEQMQRVQILSAQRSILSEAYGRATGTGSAGQFAREQNPDVIFPLVVNLDGSLSLNPNATSSSTPAPAGKYKTKKQDGQWVVTNPEGREIVRTPNPEMAALAVEMDQAARNKEEQAPEPAREHPLEAAYREAVESGDIEAQQRIVEQAGESLGLKRFNHGTTANFDKLELPDPTKTTVARMGPGIYGAVPSDTQTAETYSGGTGRVIPMFVSMDGVVRGGEMTEAQQEAALSVLDPSETLADGNQASLFIDRYKARGERTLNSLWGLFQTLGGAKWYEAMEAAGIKGATTRSAGVDEGEIVIYDPSLISPADAIVKGPSGQPLSLGERFGTPPTPPVTPERDGSPVPEDTMALKKAFIREIRELFGMDELPPVVRQRFAEVLARAKAKGLDNEADALAAELVRKSRPISAEEHAGMVLRAAQLQNQYEDLQKRAAEAIDTGDLDLGEALSKTAQNVLNTLDLITEASDKAGTEIARALSVRRMRVNRNNYELASIVQRARIAKKGQLTKAEEKRYAVLAEQIKEQDAKIDALEKELAKSQEENSRLEAETFVGEGKRRRSKSQKESTTSRRKDLKKQLAALGYRMNDITNSVGLSAEAATIVAKIAETYIEEGISTLTGVTGKIKEDFPDISDQDIFNSLAGRNRKAKKKIEKEAKIRIRELKKQARFWAKIHDALNKHFDRATIEKSSDAVKALRDILGKLRWQADRTIHDNAALKAVHEKINAVQDQLEGGFRVVPENEIGKNKPNAELEAARKTLADLRRELAAEDVIFDLTDQLRTGELASTTERPAETNERIRVAKEAIAKLRKAIAKERKAQRDPDEVNQERMDRLEAAANDLEAQIEKGFRNIKKRKDTGPEDSVQVAEFRKEVRELERLMRTEDSIFELERQLREDDFKLEGPELRVVQNVALEEALIRKKQLQRAVEQAIEKVRKKSKAEIAVEALLTPRTLKATGDLSGALRQGVILGVSRPKLFAQAFGAALKAAISENTADAIDINLQRMPEHLDRLRANLYLSTLDSNPLGREESFVGTWVERVPVLGEVVKASNRNMVTVLNLLRAGAFDQFVKDHPETNIEQRKAFAQYINWASGRGDLGNAGNKATKYLNAFFFAPRYAISRFQVFYSPIKNWNDPVVRNEILKDLGAFAGTGMTVLGLAHLAGLSVGIDPDESDFGKIVVGDTRFDIWGGLQQPFRVIIATPWTGAKRALGIKKRMNVGDFTRRFLSYKFSPALTIPWELAYGKNIIGEEKTVSNTLIESVIPLTVTDTIDTWENTLDAQKTAVVAAASLLGVGVGEYRPKTERGKERRKQKLLREKERGN